MCETWSVTMGGRWCGYRTSVSRHAAVLPTQALLLTWLTDRSWCGPLPVWDVECDDGRSLVWSLYLCVWVDRQQCYLVKALLLAWLTDISWCGPLHVWDVECDDGRTLVWLPYLCEQTCSSATYSGTAADVIDGQKLVWSPTCVRRGVWWWTVAGVVPLPVCVSRQAAVLPSQGTAAGVIDGHKLVWSPTCVRRGVWRWAYSGVVTVPLWADRQQCYLVTALLLTWLTDRSWCGPLHVWDVECDDGRTLVWLPYLCEQTGSSAT